MGKKSKIYYIDKWGGGENEKARSEDETRGLPPAEIWNYKENARGFERAKARRIYILPHTGTLFVHINILYTSIYSFVLWLFVSPLVRAHLDLYNFTVGLTRLSSVGDERVREEKYIWVVCIYKMYVRHSILHKDQSIKNAGYTKSTLYANVVRQLSSLLSRLPLFYMPFA